MTHSGRGDPPSVRKDFQTLLYLPRGAWVAVVALAAVAMGSLLVPPSVGGSLGLSFRPFFWIVAGVQLGCAVGIGGIVVYYRRPPEERDGDGDWRHGP